MNRFYGLGLILLSALCFGSYGIWAKLMGDDFGIFFQGWTRGLFIGVILFPILYFKNLIVPIQKADRKWLTVFLFCTAFTQVPLFYAFNHMDVGSASLIFFACMLLTMYVIGILFLGETMTVTKVVSFVLAFLGMALVFTISLTTFAVLAMCMALLNGVASGGEVAFSKKLTGSYSSLYISWISWVVIAITHVPLSFLFSETQFIPALNTSWLWWLIYTIISLIGFWFVIEGLKYVDASIGGLIGLLEIVFSIALGVLIFSEVVTLKIFIGAVLILVAGALPHINIRAQGVRV